MRSLCVLLALLALVSCSSSKSKRTAAPTTSPSAGTAATTTVSTAPSPTTTTASGPPSCTTEALDISVGQSSGAAGTIATPIEFRNRSSARCVLTGYPGIAGLDASGNQIAQAARTPRGMVDGLGPGNDTPPVVTLNPGATASATVESSDVNTGDQTSCPTYAALLVTPPNETHSVRLTVNLMVCSRFQVHPVQPGA